MGVGRQSTSTPQSEVMLRSRASSRLNRFFQVVPDAGFLTMLTRERMKKVGNLITFSYEGQCSDRKLLPVNRSLRNGPLMVRNGTNHISVSESHWEGGMTPNPEAVKYLSPVFAARCRIGALLSPPHDRNLQEEVQTSRDLLLIGVRDVP